MLFYYHEITHEIKQENPDHPTLIEMLNILVQVSEDLLEEKEEVKTKNDPGKDSFEERKKKEVKTKYDPVASYKKFASGYIHWLDCKN